MNKNTLYRRLVIADGALASQVAQLSHHPVTLLRCEAEITARNRYGPAMEPAAVLKAKMYFFLYHNGTGFIRLNGFIERQEKTYVLNRELHYVYDTPAMRRLKRMAAAMGTRCDSPPTVNMPEIRFPPPLGDLLQSEDPRISYHVAIEHVLGNLYVVSTLQSPTFVCRRY